MNPIELIDKKLQDNKSLLRLAMAMKFAMLFAEAKDDEQCSDLKDRTI
jgi:hypothetical protein